MTLAATSSEPQTLSGEVRFTSASLRARLEQEADRQGLLVVGIAPPRPAQRGRLALLIESAVEEALGRRGAAPPGVGASSDLDASLSDQLYRARQIGARGLALSLPALEGIANLAHTLDAEDSAVLRWWLLATDERPVRLFFDEADRFLGIYDEPVALSSLIERAPVSGPRAPRPAPELAASAAAMELSEPPPVVVSQEPLVVTPEPPATVEKPAETDELARAMASLFDETTDSEPVPDVASHERSAEPPTTWQDTEPTEATPGVAEAEVEEAPRQLRLEALELEPSEPPAPVGPSREVDEIAHAEPELARPEPELAPEPVLARPEPELAPELELQSEPELAPEPEADVVALAEAPRPTAPPLDPEASERWRGWVRELEGARGPKPLAVVERMFASAYVPLADAVLRDVTGPGAEAVLEAWADSFDKSYTEAFDALRVRGKRPTMVLDVPDIALRLGRLHGARTVQLILVDGMRFDLGLRVNEHVRARVGEHAALTERLLLWSALPTKTEVQVELIARGPAGLAELTDQADTEIPVARGRSATTLRRIRAGQRELFKLDVIESAMSVPGGPLAERLDTLAEEAGDALAKHLLKLPPRTLALVFGDHGFVVDPMGTGTTAGRHGGSSPEEVLVPAFAWLVGAVH